MNIVLNAINNDWKTVLQRIENKKDVSEYLDEYGNNLLMIALKQKQMKDLIIYLVDKVDLDHFNHNGELSIHIACQHLFYRTDDDNSYQILQYILCQMYKKEGMDINVLSTNHQFSCLHYVIGKVQTVGYICNNFHRQVSDCNENCNYFNNDEKADNLKYYYLYQEMHRKIIVGLLELGADVNCTTSMFRKNYGITPFLLLVKLQQERHGNLSDYIYIENLIELFTEKGGTLSVIKDLYKHN